MQRMTKLLLLGMLLVPLWSLAASVLWFTVNPASEVMGPEGSLGTVAVYEHGGMPINAARVSIANGGSPAEQYLRLYYEIEGRWLTSDGVEIALLEDGSLPWQPADLDGVDPSATLRLELGYVDIYSSGIPDFTPLAYAEGTLSGLDADGHVSDGGVSVQSQTPWNPTTYTAIPEPTATALLALGTALLALKRRRGAPL